MILVVGATGLLGSAICARLRDEGRPVRALVRDGSPGDARLRQLGCEIARGDLKNSTTLAGACRGATLVITTANAAISRRSGDSMQSVDRDGSLALVAAAKAEGVRHFIYTSVSPALPADNDFVRAKRIVEAALRSSGLTWTILQPAPFMEIHAGAVAGWDFARGRARILGNGRAPVSYISLDDVAAFAVASVSNQAAANRALHLVGPKPLSAFDAVAIAERVTGRRFRVQRAPASVLSVLSVVVHPFNPAVSALMRMGAAFNLGETADMTAVLRDFPIRRTTFEEVRPPRSQSVGVTAPSMHEHFVAEA